MYIDTNEQGIWNSN